MIVRRLEEIAGTAREVSPESRNWLSRRLLLKDDGMGFSFHDTVVRAGTETLIHYKRHLEAVYCIEGEGEVELIDGGETIPLRPGTLYVLDRHERHFLRALREMRIICVFTPPLRGGEVHGPDGSYEAEGERPAPPSLRGAANRPRERLKFAYLNLREHPRGNFMLRLLVEEGFVPDLLVEEDSTLAARGRKTLLGELEKASPGVPLPPTAAEALAGRPVARIVVPDHNGPECEGALGDLDPDLILLGDTRILRTPILTIPEIGIVNVHPGYLPEVRGNTPYVWAVVKDLPQGCSAHFIDEGIDSGPILLRQKIRLPRGASFPLLLCEINRLCAELAVEVMHLVRTGVREGIPQDNFSFPAAGPEALPLAPPDVRREAAGRLERGDYGHLT
jgi:quercetin dioxygenase-like cupin family protein